MQTGVGINKRFVITYLNLDIASIDENGGI